MSVKLIALGNVLMKDDAIGIEVAKEIEDMLKEYNIEVIYGETDISYCLTQIDKNDIIFVVDAASYGVNPGDITVIPIHGFSSNGIKHTQHNYNLLDLLKLYYPDIKGEIFAVKINEVEFHYGLSLILQKKLKTISKEVFYRIQNDIANLIKIMERKI